ncbi:hypothetical protein [Draconibacterium halophilum]|uniref:Uncharacterized protein n=1 Tax=Draconibacterium halophilum TaxID=2706887 RepID=A0A6C0RIU8_9BACT|nr:hypothetical protein [Draconibacterium halophilum]QIA09535.1 hypothetical protein G0Q07_18280 [Draconibacterium halophilum]
MKNIQTLIYTIALVGLLSCNKDELVIQQGECMPFSISDTYEYPIVPGTDEWADLKSLTEKVQACQIPNKKLKFISTEGLLETLLTYPLILDYGAFNMKQDGFERIKSENNGFAELYGRTDFVNAITERYKLMSLNCDKNYYPPFISGIETPIQISFQTIEFFMLQDELLNKTNSNQRIQILEIVLEKLQAKKEYGISQYENLVSYAILGKIMIQENYSPFVEINDENELVSGLERIPIGFNSEMLDLIEDNAKELKASS